MGRELFLMGWIFLGGEVKVPGTRICGLAGETQIQKRVLRRAGPSLRDGSQNALLRMTRFC